MKKKSKLIILLGLVFTMLFGNIFTVSAAETTANWWQMITGKSVLGSSFEFQGNISDINNYYDINLTYGESSVPVYGYAYAVQGTAYGPESYAVYVYLYSESPFSVMGTNINCNGDEIESEKENLGSYDVMKSSYQGKEYYSTGFNSVNTGIIKSDLPVNLIKPEKPIYNFNQLLDYLLGGGDSDFIYKPTPDEVDETLYLKNIRWKTEALTGSGGKEDCYCFMSWDTNNLLTGDTVDIRVDSWYQHYILGKKVSGVYDVITNKSVDDFSSTSWSHAYSYGLDLLKGSLYFDYLTFPMLYANSIDNSIKNIYNGGVSAMYLRLNRLDSKTGKSRQGLWVKVNFKESSVSYPDIDSIQAGTIDEETGIFTPNNNTDYGENGYGINGETGNIVPPNGGGNFGDIDSIDELGEYLFNSLKKLFASLGQFPTFLSSVFSFIPLPIIALIGGSIVVVIILRILGR